MLNPTTSGGSLSFTQQTSHQRFRIAALVLATICIMWGYSRYMNQDPKGKAIVNESRSIPATSPMWEMPGEQQATDSRRFPAKTPFLEALSTCHTLECVHDAHLQPRGDARFNFPHFMITGWPKCATTSLYQHLHAHPEAQLLTIKEPSLFNGDCTYDTGKMVCDPERQARYIDTVLKKELFIENKGQQAPYESTPGTMAIGVDLASDLYKVFPWVKLIASLREPISRTMSNLIMLQDKRGSGCLASDDIGTCLLKSAKNTEDKKDPHKPTYGTDYSRPLAAWLNSFPTNQIFLTQYEDLTSEEREEYELRRLKDFIGIDNNLPNNTLSQSDVNCRKCRIKPEGWEVKEATYRHLIELVKPDVYEVVRLIERYNLGNATRWVENWEKVWADNLATCSTFTGMCLIRPS